MVDEFAERLKQRAFALGVPLDAGSIDKLTAYLELLERWNAKINLTALRLSPLGDHALDRLLIEPLLAANEVADSAIVWFDLGSGGGSPAIPLKILRPSLRLTLVESTGKKAAFLREAIRTLELANCDVENRRFEELSQSSVARHTAELVTARAVHRGSPLFESARNLLSPAGKFWIFRSAGPFQRLSMLFRRVRSVPLATKAALDILAVEE